VGALAIGSIFFMGYISKLTGEEFVNAEDRGQFVVEAELPAGTSLEETARATQSVESELLTNPQIKVVFATKDVQEAITAFREKRMPTFEGR